MKRFYSIVAVILSLAFFVLTPIQSFATTSEELQEQQKKLEEEEKALKQQKKAAENEKAASQNKLNEANSQISESTEALGETQEAIDSTNAEIVGLMTDIELIKEDITEKETQIDQTNAEYEDAKNHEETLYGSMVQRVKFMYEKGNLSYVQLLLTATSYADALNKAQYIEELYEYDRQKLSEYVAAKEAAAALAQKLEEEKAELEASQFELEEEEAYMEELLAQYKATYADYEVKLAKAKQDAAVYTAQVKSQQASIAGLQKKIEAKQKEVDAAKQAAQNALEAERAAAEAENSSGSDSGGSSSGGSSGSSSSSGSSRTYAAAGSATGSNIAKYACQFVGNPYVPGGTSLTDGADCSGFVQSVYKAFGISVPRTSWGQGAYGREVSYADAQPGDVIYYGGHVGIYIGGGQIVHASTQKTGIKYSPATYRSIITVRRFL
ncbi:C40 family peptidase [Butyrivibrio sp. XPD2006]|uniref:C40 family peptidase n=1 Tax=Butyrivibrio sp. XPD2006 TaxID=1280668 RepID=UPI0003B493A6|nr:C40 family peptidase [Butyrivibrio sp. XPD2006]